MLLHSFYPAFVLKLLSTEISNSFLFSFCHDNYVFIFLVILDIILVCSWVSPKALQGLLSTNLKKGIRRLTKLFLVNLLIAFTAVCFLNFYHFSSLAVLYGFALFVLAQMALQALLRKNNIIFSYSGSRKLLLIGNEDISIRLLRYFDDETNGYDMVDFISEDKIRNISFIELTNLILRSRPNEMFVCLNKIDEILFNQLLAISEEHFIDFKVVPDMQLGSNVQLNAVKFGNLPVIEVSTHNFLRAETRLAKRIFDIVFSTLVMLLGSPVFLIVMILTKVTSKGPVFYRQVRAGVNGRPFYIYKFRSMYVDAEKHGPQCAKDNDPRITKWGRLIRSTRIDELPQFWNVIKGDMSVVGPRPERQYYIDQIIKKNPAYKNLLKIKPGITSIGQVNYGYAENVDQMCARVFHDLDYLPKVSLYFDLRIIYKTVKVMVQGRGK